MANKDKYAVLVEDHSKDDRQQQQEIRPIGGRGFRRPSNQQQQQLESASKRTKKGRCQRLPSCMTWPLLLAISTACVALVTFHLWFTWHLQRKVEILQTRVDTLTTLDLEDLRAQLRNLYDLYDGNTEMKDDLPAQSAFDDQDQESDQPGKILLMDFRHADGEKTDLLSMEDGSTEKDITLFSSKLTTVAEPIVEPARGQRNLKSRVDRRKRQADLSSHTQDGVPIFDRGYGVMPNRTEGLRIYQSLLSGRNEPKTSEVTDSPILPHHRQNSFWRGRKEKPRHRHQQRPSTTSPMTDDVELSAVPEFDATNEQELRSTATTSSPSKNSAAPNVEFRHSRVKTSSENRESVPLSVLGDQKVWATSRSNGMADILALGALPHAGTSQEDRISAATAPAILTKTVTASVGPSASNRARQQQPNVYKVTQPALMSRLPAQTDNSGGDESVPRESVPASSSSSSKKRVNKKQLRDLSHTAIAVHLVADTRNVSSANFENQVEIASRNELGLHTSWKIAANNWDSPLKTTPLVKIDGAILTVKQSGLYFIYAQVHYLDDHSTNAYEVFINTEPFLRCVTSAYSESSLPKANTCYTAAAAHLREGDKLFLRDIEPLRYSVLQPSKTFFGLVRMAPIADSP